MITYSLLALIALMSILIKDERKIPYVIFVAPAILFQIVSGNFPNIYFHLFACSLDLVVIILLSMLNKVNSSVVFIGAISVFSVFANIFGWLLYQKGYSAVSYDSLFIGIYAAVAVASFGEWLGAYRNICNYIRIFRNRV